MVMIIMLDGYGLFELVVIFILGNGFIIILMLWIVVVVVMIDGRLLCVLVFLLVVVVLILFGLIYLVDLCGGIYLLW